MHIYENTLYIFSANWQENFKVVSWSYYSFLVKLFKNLNSSQSAEIVDIHEHNYHHTQNIQLLRVEEISCVLRYNVRFGFRNAMHIRQNNIIKVVIKLLSAVEVVLLQSIKLNIAAPLVVGASTAASQHMNTSVSIFIVITAQIVHSY